MYVLALDGESQPCVVRSSNAGHCLFSGIVDEQRAKAVADALVDPEFFSGWGIRTVATTEARYNPMSYHNGTIWPHDNAIIEAGFARYGFKGEAAKVLTALFDASMSFDLHRLPELFCGFERRAYEEPVRYPVSCAPQAWAAGAVLMLLQACLGIEIHWPERRVLFVDPWLPEYLPEVEIRGLMLGDAAIDLRVTRGEDGVGVEVTRGGQEVSVEVVSR
jgi:glycogen debranching enzyme